MLNGLIGSDYRETHRLWQHRSVIWEKTWRRWTHTSMDGLRETLLQRGHVRLREKSALQTPWKLRKSKPDRNETSLRSDRNRLGWIRSGYKDIFPWSYRTSRHLVSYPETLPIACCGTWKFTILSWQQEGSCIRSIWRDRFPRTYTAHATLLNECPANNIWTLETWHRL